MKTENVSTLKINKLTQAQYDRELAAGNIDENALYLTPDEAITPESIGAAAASHTHDITDVGALDLMLEGFDLELDAKVPTSRKVNGKALSSDITLSASDIGAAESGHTHSLKDDTITGTLSVSKGGTGSTSASKSVTINRGADIGTGSDAFGYTCKYIPYLNMCFMRVYVQPKEAWTADTEYEVATVGSSTYFPHVMVALSNYAQKEVSAYINTEGQIIVRPYEGVGTSYGIRLAGFWFCQ